MQDVHVPTQRIRLHEHLRRLRPGLGQIDPHIAEKRYGEQLLLDIPARRA